MAANTWEDHYARRARQEKWLARSVYKLQEIDGRFKLIRRGDRLLDLGCYPGSWSQYALRQAGPAGQVVGIDLRRPERLDSPGFRFLEGDVLGLDGLRLAEEIGARSVVLSDLAPQTTGVRSIDVSRSFALAEKALAIAAATLEEQGRFLCKVFEGEELRGFRTRAAARFRRVQLLRPRAVRKGSIEIYLVGLSFHRSGE